MDTDQATDIIAITIYLRSDKGTMELQLRSLRNKKPEYLLTAENVQNARHWDTKKLRKKEYGIKSCTSGQL